MDKDRPLRGNAARSTTAMHAIIWRLHHGEFVRCAVCFRWHQEATISAVAVAELRVVGTGQLVDNRAYALCDDCCAPFLKSPEMQRAVWAYLMPEIKLKKEGEQL